MIHQELCPLDPGISKLRGGQKYTTFFKYKTRLTYLTVCCRYIIFSLYLWFSSPNVWKQTNNCTCDSGKVTMSILSKWECYHYSYHQNLLNAGIYWVVACCGLNTRGSTSLKMLLDNLIPYFVKRQSTSEDNFLWYKLTKNNTLIFIVIKNISLYNNL